MKKKYLTYIFLFFFITSNACDCNWSGNFIKSSKHSELVIKAKVIEILWHFEDGKILSTNKDFGNYLIETDEKYYRSIKIEVLDVIKGNEVRKEFEIYGTDGVDCRESIHIFELKKTYVFNLYKSKKTKYSQPNEDEKDYSIGGCSENWLEYLPKTNEVKGYIKGKNRRRKKIYCYEKLRKKITKNNGIF